MRRTLTTAAELAGATSVTVGVTMWSAPAGFVVGGLLAMLFGWLAGDE